MADAVPSYEWPRMQAKLAEPMPQRKRSGRAGQTYSYLVESDIRDRLNEAVGFGNWGCTYGEAHVSVPTHVNPQTGEVAESFLKVGMKCAITIHGVTREDWGETLGEREYAYKSAATDAFKRAAQKWGIEVKDEPPARRQPSTTPQRPNAPSGPSSPPESASAKRIRDMIHDGHGLVTGRDLRALWHVNPNVDLTDWILLEADYRAADMLADLLKAKREAAQAEAALRGQGNGAV